MDESLTKDDFDDRGLSLIDFSSEDDWLINSPPGDLQTYQFPGNQVENRSCDLFEIGDANNVETSRHHLEERVQVPQTSESLQPDMAKKNGNYNLRKSLAWDSAFFTSAGFLDPEELSSMIGGPEKGEKHRLPAIQEVVHRSTDSISTLESDSLALESVGADLFEDIRASIQKSSTASKVETSSASKKVDVTAQNKLKPKPAPKKPSIGKQGSVQLRKQVSLFPQELVSAATCRESISSLSKPPKVVGRASLVATTKRASMGANRSKIEKDNTKSATGRGTSMAKTPTLGGSRNIVPRPARPSKSSSGSSVTTKQELTSSCSSFDSSSSVASDNFGKSSLNSIKRKTDSRTHSSSSSGSTAKTPSRIAARNKNLSGSSHLSAYLMSVTNVSSSISPASSIGDWSTASSSSNSNVKQRTESSGPRISTSASKRGSVDSSGPKVLDSGNRSNDQCLLGQGSKVNMVASKCLEGLSKKTGALHPDSKKPSGLRMPSPKIGFFDGVKSAVRTPNGSMRSHPPVTNDLPKIGAGNFSPSGGSNKGKVGNLEPAKTISATWSAKPDAPQTNLSIKSGPPFLQGSSNTAAKVSSGLKSIKGSPIISPKVQNRRRESMSTATKPSSASKNAKSSPTISPKLPDRKSPRTGGGRKLKTEEVGPKGCDVATEDPDFGFTQKNGGSGILHDKLVPESNHDTHVNKVKVTPIGEEPSICNVGNIINSQKDGDAKYHQFHTMDNQHSPCNVNEKETSDQVHSLIKQVGALDINMESQKELVGDSTLPCQVDANNEDNSTGPGLSKPCGQKEDYLSDLSQSTPLPLIASECTSTTRVPSPVKDSFCNGDGSVAVSSTSRIVEIEKPTTLCFPESIPTENS